MKRALLFCLLLLSFSLHGEEFGQVIFQPQFIWCDGSQSLQGTGSFVRAPNGRIVAMTSIHFLDLSRFQLQSVNWLKIPNNKAVATFTKTYGLIGKEGSFHPIDLQTDYLFFDVETPIDPSSILEIDPGHRLEVGDDIWFPNKDFRLPLGYKMQGGRIKEIGKEYITVELDQKVDTQGRSGTPIISQKNNKVIGILGGSQGRTLFLTPGSNLYKALRKDESLEFKFLKNK